MTFTKLDTDHSGQIDILEFAAADQVRRPKSSRHCFWSARASPVSLFRRFAPRGVGSEECAPICPVLILNVAVDAAGEWCAASVAAAADDTRGCQILKAHMLLFVSMPGREISTVQEHLLGDGEDIRPIRGSCCVGARRF